MSTLGLPTSDTGYVYKEKGRKQLRKYIKQPGSENTKPHRYAKFHLQARVRSQHSMEKLFVNTTADKYPIRLDFSEFNSNYFPGLYMAASSMNINEKAKFIVPPKLAYGNEGKGREVPPGSWLVLDMWMIESDGRKALGVRQL